MADHMNLCRGFIVGLTCGLTGLVGLPVMIAAGTLVSGWLRGADSFDRQYDIMWWKGHAFPAIVVIPMLLFFAGFVTVASRRRVGFLKNFALLSLVSLPLSTLLGVMGMAPPRYKSIEHPSIYFSEILMFLLPQIVVSVLLMPASSNPKSNVNEVPEDLPPDATLRTGPSE